jgi:hypothetical protein
MDVSAGNFIPAGGIFFTLKNYVKLIGMGIFLQTTKPLQIIF